jgi:thiol-disulfide isomerase/thioredoxin
MKTPFLSKTARLTAALFPAAFFAGATLLLTGGAPKPATMKALPAFAPVTDIGGHVYDGRTIAAHRATVFVFLSTQCPVSKVYAPRLNALAREYGARGVQMVGVFSNMQEGQPEVAAFAKERGLAFPVVRDGDASFAARFHAMMTPQAFVVNPMGAVVYSGRVDDSADASQVHHRDLKEALDTVLAGRPVARARTVAFGCIIRRPAAQVASSQITYARDVAPILQRQCETCHRPGQIGPMALTTYAQAAAWRGDIKRYTESRQMPPWKADPGAGDFQDARRLSGHEIATLAKWADAGAPEGDPKDLPPPAHFHDDWALGKPDMVLQPSRPYHVDADGGDVYRCYVIPTDFTQNRYVSAVDVQPGNRAVVHHVIAFIDGEGKSANLDGHEKEPGYTSFGGVGFTPTGALGGWAPGITAHYLPAGVATEVPAGARIVLQVHYHKDGKPESDLSRVGIYFAKGPVDKTLHVIPVVHSLQIPPNDPHYTVSTMSVPSPVNYHLIAITPHMHLLGRSMKLTAIKPDGAKVPLVSVSDWDFNWQSTYFYKKPLALPKGTRVVMTATYDNSAQNPRNPNTPPKPVTWGEQTTDEMCIAFLHYTLDREHLAVRDHPAGKVAQK